MTNGFGTSYYGKRDFRSDGSWLTTKWFVIFWIPIFPIRSLRIAWAFDENDLGLTPRSMPLSRIEYWNHSFISHYKFVSSERFSIRQVSYVYLYCIGGLPVLSLIMHMLPANMIQVIAAPLFIIGWSLLPWLLRKHAQAQVAKTR
jgi:hypothetical protein